MKATRDITITVAIGEQKFSPVDYNTFCVGPFSATITVKQGEDLDEAISEAHAILLNSARLEYKRALDAYTKALTYNDSWIKNHSKG